MPNADAICCPLCEAPALLVRAGFAGYRAPDVYDIHECDKCDLQFAWPFKSDASVYDAIYRQPEKLAGYDRYLRLRNAVREAADPLAVLTAAESMYWFVADKLAELDPDRTRRVLEVGCGLGYLTYALNKAGHNVQGLDISAAAVEGATQAFGPNYMCADVNQFASTTAERFDIVIMTEVIEHLDAPLDILRSIRALLKPGGVALISTPSKDFLPRGAVWRTDNPPVHLAWYSQTALREMARRTGFRVRFADFRRYHEAKVGNLGRPRDLSSGQGAFRLSATNQPLDELKPPRKASLLDKAFPAVRRFQQRRKLARRALELYAEQSEVMGAILLREH